MSYLEQQTTADFMEHLNVSDEQPSMEMEMTDANAEPGTVQGDVVLPSRQKGLLQQHGAESQPPDVSNTLQEQYMLEEPSSDMELDSEDLQEDTAMVDKKKLPKPDGKMARVRRKKRGREENDFLKFSRFAGKVIHDLDASKQIQFSDSAMEALHEASESFLIGFFEDCKALAARDNTATVNREHIRQQHAVLLGRREVQTPAAMANQATTASGLTAGSRGDATGDSQDAGETLE